MDKSRRGRKRKPRGFKQCLECKIKFPVKMLSEHYLSRQHITNANRLYDNSTIVDIHGMSKDITLEACNNFLSSFGRIENIVLFNPQNPGVIRVTFKNAQDTFCLKNSNEPILYQGSKILACAVRDPNIKSIQENSNIPTHAPKTMVSKKEEKRKTAKVVRSMEMKEPEAIILNLRGDFNNQLMGLMTNIRLKISDIQLRSEICQDIETVVKSQFPACNVFAFGSVVTGLAFVGSDMDCYCDVKMSPQYLDVNGLGDGEIMNRAVKLFRRSKKFHILFTVPRAKVPLIKIKHLRSNILIDLNFKSPFGVANSEIINHLLLSDSRLIPLTVFIKYWANSLNLIQQHKFTSYGITLLVIFYLQMLHDPILPAISFLQKHSQHDLFFGPWNIGFSKEKLPTNKNDQCVLSLIEGFFDFYSEFAFDKFVLCPFVGLAITPEKFIDRDLPLEYDCFINNVSRDVVKNLSFGSAVVIQDPIELDRNCTATVQTKSLNEFIYECKASSCVIKRARANNDQFNLIVKLTSLCKYEPRDDLYQTLTYLIPIKIGKSPNSLRAATWSNNVIDYTTRIVENILRNIAMCEFSVRTSSYDVTDPCISFNCEAHYNLWTGRNNYKRYDGLLTVQEEQRVSMDMFDTLYANGNPERFLFSFAIDINILARVKVMELKLKPIVNSDAYTFCDFIHTILLIIETELRLLHTYI